MTRKKFQFVLTPEVEELMTKLCERMGEDATTVIRTSLRALGWLIDQHDQGKLPSSPFIQQRIVKLNIGNSIPRKAERAVTRADAQVIRERLLQLWYGDEKMFDRVRDEIARERGLTRKQISTVVTHLRHGRYVERT